MSEININVNGKNIPLTEFPEKIIKNTLLGMLESLKGINDIETFEIRFQK